LKRIFAWNQAKGEQERPGFRGTIAEHRAREEVVRAELDGSVVEIRGPLTASQDHDRDVARRRSKSPNAFDQVPAVLVLEQDLEHDHVRASTADE